MKNFSPWEPPGAIPIDIPGWPSEFENRPGLTFVRPPGPNDALWWDHRFGMPHKLTPVGMAAALFDGLPGDGQSIAYHYIDHEEESFLIGVRGTRGEAEIWAGGVALELRKDTLLWDKAESHERGLGVGKAMAGNLLDCARKFDLPYIEVNTEKVGSHLWADAGFYPYGAVWLSMRMDLWRRFLEVQRHVSRQSADILGLIITGTGSDPRLIRAIARLPDEVPCVTRATHVRPGWRDLGARCW